MSSFNFLKILFFIISSLSFLTVSGQEYLNEPSEKFPFGKVHPDLPSQASDWDPLIGVSDCKSLQRNNDGTWKDTTSMVWEYRYIFDGRSVQDITLKEDGNHSSSIRQYIPDSAAWYVTYFSSTSPAPVPSTWKGGKAENGDIVLYKDQKTPTGMEGYYKILFYDISESGFNWKGAWVDKKETIEYPTWEIFCTKRSH